MVQAVALAELDGITDPNASGKLPLIDKDPTKPALEKFIRGLIVEEFSGREPSPRQLAGLASYVRAVRACPGRTSEPRNLASDLTLLRATIDGAIGLLDRRSLAQQELPRQVEHEPAHKGERGEEQETGDGGEDVGRC